MGLIMKDLYLGEEESSRNSLGSSNSYARAGCSQHGLGAGKSMAVVAAHQRAFRLTVDIKAFVSLNISIRHQA
jgi:hypothetical protein